jgi:hypothetical protein
MHPMLGIRLIGDIYVEPNTVQQPRLQRPCVWATAVDKSAANQQSERQSMQRKRMDAKKPVAAPNDVHSMKTCVQAMMKVVYDAKRAMCVVDAPSEEKSEQKTFFERFLISQGATHHAAV